MPNRHNHVKADMLLINFVNTTISNNNDDEDDITGLNSLKKTHQFNKKPMN